MTTEAILAALVIFVLRVANNAISTIRVVLITRQQRLLASVLGFIESLVFAVTITSVVTDLSNWLNLVAYSAGFSVGAYLGMFIEARFITSYMTVNIISKERGHEIAVALRDAGFGVTETAGEGRDGQVTILRSVVLNREVPRLMDVIRATHEDAFVAIEQARHIQRGYLRASRPLVQ
ncbi:MAG: DUF5698 domain-containing protein [Chloroflexota bacterium]